jgi:hypothetical protein
MRQFIPESISVKKKIDVVDNKETLYTLEEGFFVNEAL